MKKQRVMCFSLCVQKFPTDKAYFLAKELLTTERTYLKDLHVVTTVRNTQDPTRPATC